MLCGRRSCSWAQMPVPTEVEPPCCASIHRGQVLQAICASFLRMAAASRTSGWWLSVTLCRRCAACLA